MGYNPHKMLRWVGALIAAGLLFPAACTTSRDPLPGFPKLVLWAWERPENLSYIVPAVTGVAYLADTIALEPDGVRRYPRAQPLYVPGGTPLIAVVRLESHTQKHLSVADVVSEILRVSRNRSIRAVQIDYDARLSERIWYRELMSSLRQNLPPRLTLEMTALVSWCQSDDWIRAMPVADAVPMFFRMGADPHSTQERLRDPLCMEGIGISTDEFHVSVPRGKRVYVFTSQPWTEAAYRAVLRASRSWS